MDRSSRYRREPVKEKKAINFKKIMGLVFVLTVIALVVYGLVLAFKSASNYRVKRIIPKHYFVSYNEKEKNYSVINAKGETVLDAKYEEYILIPNKEKNVFLITGDVDYKKGSYKVKAINENGNEVLKEYENLEPIEYYGKEAEFDKNALRYSKDKKYGIVSYDGKTKLEPIFSEIKVMENIKDRLLVKEKDKWGVVDTTKIDYIVQPLYKSVKPITEEKDTGYIVQFDKKYGVINGLGKEVLKGEYDSIEKIPSTEYFKASKEGKTNIYNSEGKIAVKGDIKNIKSLEENNLINTSDGKWGVIDFNKKQIIPYKYEEIKLASVGKYIVKEKGKYNIRTKTEENLIKNSYNSIVYNKDMQLYIASNDSNADIYDLDLNKKLTGIISNIDYEKSIFILNKNGEEKIYNFKCEEKSEEEVYPENNLHIFKGENGLYGYKNDKGKIIVEAKYNDAKMQNQYGYIAVNSGGKWGVLSYDGSEILSPSVNLDDHLVIEFIGEYHLDKDLSLNIYVK